MTFCLVVAQKTELELISPPDDLLLRAEETWVKRQIEGASLEAACRLDHPFFAKPLAPKLFRAGVFSDGSALAAHTDGFAPETPVLVAEPVIFRCEARCLIRDGVVVSAAFYEGDGDLTEATRFAEAFAAENALPRTLALNVGEIEGRGWGVIEANAVWGAGLNGCDPDKMVDCLQVSVGTGFSPISS